MKASERRALKLKKDGEKKEPGTIPAPVVAPVVNKETNNETPAIEKISKDGTKRGLNPNSTKNLKPIKPGEVRNPNGRPEGALSWDTRIELNMTILAQKYVRDFNKKNPKKAIKIEEVDMESDIFQQYINKARNGNDKILLHFMDKRYGRPSQPIVVTGKDGDPVEYTIRVKEYEDEILQEENKWFESDTKK